MFTLDDIVYSYTRKDALADGMQVRIPDDIRSETGISYPVFVTRTVWDKYLTVPEEMADHQDLDGRIWDLLYMFALKASRTDASNMKFQVIFRMPDKGNWEENEVPVDGNKLMREVTLNAVIGPLDIDDASPAITIMKPGED